MKMNPIQKAWDKEYAKKTFMTGERPPSSLVNFIKWLKKKKDLRGKELALDGIYAVDIGSGEGKNAVYLAERGANVLAVDISPVAIDNAKRQSVNPNISFKASEMIDALEALNNESVDIVLDIMSSHFLSHDKRRVYLENLHRILKPGAYFFIRTMLLDGDKNAKELIKKYPGKEEGTYVLPNLGLQEKVFRLDEFKNLFSKYFKIVKIDHEEHYSKFNGRAYKRKYITAILQKI